jgi:pyruvate/2-oxoglutarate dehydrogenase complex dihydrolipoamide dehydrogenase (E3) component
MAEVDHGYQALPVAELLADQGHEVTVVSTAFEPCINQDFFTSEQAYRRLLPKGVKLVTTTEVTGVRDGEVDIRNIYTRRTGSLPADSVVVSYGGVANDSLVDQLQERRANVFSAGDCVSPRDIAGAVSDGMRVMEKLAAVVRG